MKKDILRQILVVFSLIVTIVVNGLANALPFNGLSTAQVSDSFKVFFVPAGYVFSIWGVIYLGLLAYAIYQALPAQRENPRLRRTGWLFVLSSVANGSWLLLWHYQFFVWTLVVMATLLVSLILIYLRLGTGTANTVSKAETWMVRIPFSLYLGWITVATIANATEVFSYLNWGGFGIAQPVWAVIMLGVAVVVAGLMAFTRKDIAYLLVLVWAFIGIAVKFPAVQIVNVAAFAAAGVVAFLVLLTLFMSKQNLKKW